MQGRIAFRISLKDAPQVLSSDNGVAVLLGFDEDELLSGEVIFQDRIHPDDEDEAVDLFAFDVAPRAGNFNIRIRHAKGEIRCIKGEYTKCPDPFCEELLLTLTMEDARTVTEAGDLSLLSHFKALLEDTTDYIYVKNCNHIMLGASKIVRELATKVDHWADLSGKTDYDLHSEQEADRYYRLEKQLLLDGQCVSEIQEVVARDGTKRWIDNRKYRIKGPDDEVVGLLGIAHNITGFIEATQRLSQSEEWLREAQKIGGLGSFVLDIPSRQWKASEELDAILGIEPGYDRGLENIWPLVHPDDRAAMAARFREYFAGERKAFDSEYRIIRRTDGALRWVQAKGRLEFDSQGNPDTLRGTIQDITERKLSDSALRESKELLDLFIKHAPVPLAMFDCEMRYLAVSRGWLREYELVGQQIIGRAHYEVSPNVPEHWKSVHRRGLAGETFKFDEDRIEHSDGTVQWVRWEMVPWRTGEGAVGGIVLFQEDITPQKRVEERLRLAASVFTHAREGIVITDADGAILDVNETFTRITGYSREEVLGRNPRLLQSGLQDTEFYRKLWRSLLEDGQWTGEMWNRTKDGEIYAEMLTISAIHGNHGQVLRYVALFSDITELKDQQRQLERIAHYDILTGLPNRALLADRLKQAIIHSRRYNRSLAVAYLDLDGFKEINDNYGHTAGDQLLSTLASQMKSSLRAGDTIARLGGDEFVVLLLYLSEREEALPVLGRLQSAAASHIQIDGHSLRVSASIGITYYPQAEEIGADQLLRQADQAMYQAKLAGKNGYHIFDPTHDHTVRSRYEGLEQVRGALANRQFVLHYQPKVNMRTGDVIGAEALLRIEHPERGLVAPGAFMPAVEDHPLAIEIGDWVIETALAQMEAWKLSGVDLPVSVNVSGFHLQRPDFAARLQAMLAAHPTVMPSSLELEVLESSALLDVAQASEVLDACHRMGISIALDDFGTGYSSLAYLRQLPAHTLKIDRSFVMGMIDDLEDLSIVEGVLSLAKAFGRQVIAEGVEGVEHGLILLQLGCELAQGFGIARPMSASDLPAWRASWQPDPRWTKVRPRHNCDLPLLYAGVEHSAALAGLEGFLAGKLSTPPQLEIQRCSLSTWLNSNIQPDDATFPAIQELGAIHQRFHGAVERVLALLAEGSKSGALARLEGLRSVREELLENLLKMNGKSQTQQA